MSNSTTAILFFSRNAKAEATAKCWFGDNRDVFLAQELVNQSYKALKSTGLPVIHIDETQQSGVCFGERFSNTIAHVFQLGFDQVIAVGNDNPELESTPWDQVLIALDSGKAILSPTRRGGSCIIALNKQSFNKSAFAKLPWQKRELLTSLHSYFKEIGVEVFELSEVIDLNILSDLKSFIKERTVNHALKMLVNLLLSHKPMSSDNRSVIIPTRKMKNEGMRAPPAAS